MNSMTHLEKSRWKRWISILFAFFLSLFLFFLSVLAVAQGTVLNPDYMRKQLDASHYYDHVITEVEDEFVSYASASGFDGRFFQTLLDLNDVQMGVNHSLSVLYGESGRPEDTSDFEEKLYEKLSENVKGRGIAFSPAVEQGLRLLAKTCADTYIQYISIPYAGELAPAVQKIKRPLLLSEFALTFLIVFLSAAIFRLNRWRHRALRAYLYAAFGAALMLAVFPSVILLSGKVNQLAMISRSMYAFAVCYLNGILYDFLLCALMMGMIGLALGLLYRSAKGKACREE